MCYKAMLLSTHALARQRQGIEVNASLPRGSSFSCSHRLRAGESNTAPLLNFTGMACCWTSGDQNVLASKLGQIKRAISVGGRSQISLMRDTCTTTSSAITFRKDPVCANRRFEEPQTVCSSVTAPVFQWEVSDTFRAFARSSVRSRRWRSRVLFYLSASQVDMCRGATCRAGAKPYERTGSTLRGPTINDCV
jgi:hypothetical protein